MLSKNLLVILACQTVVVLALHAVKGLTVARQVSVEA